MTDGPLVLVVEPEGRARTEHLPPPGHGRLAALQAMVGGYVEAVGGGGWTAFANEDGRRMMLKPNGKATVMATRLGARFLGPLVGTVVFGGHPEGSDVPPVVLQCARDLHMTVTGTAGEAAGDGARPQHDWPGAPRG